MRLAIALPAPHDARIAKEAARHGHDVVLRSTGAEELVAACEATRPDVAIVWSSAEALTSALLTHCDARGVRLLAVVGDAADRHRAHDIGLFETISVLGSWKEFERAFTTSLTPGSGRATPGTDQHFPSDHGAGQSGPDMADEGPGGNRAVARPRVSAGTVIAVWGTAGSPGRTTTAISIAAELAALGYSVALADVDTHSAAVAPSLGILDESPGFAAACRLAGTDSLTRTELERIGQRYSGRGPSFWVLTGIGQPSRWPELSAQRVSATILECRKWVDFTVLDTGFSLENDEEISSDLLAPRRNAATIAAVRDADHIVAVGAADPVGLSRFLRAHSDLLELAHTGSVTVVMNKVRASAIGLNPAAQVVQTLSRFGGIDSPVLIPYDQQAMDAALLSGRTVQEVAPKSAARVAVRELVRSRLVPQFAQAESPAAARQPRSRFAPATTQGSA